MITELYRHYSEAGELLYVGTSLTTVRRFIEHKRESGWSTYVAKITVERFPTEAAALSAETAAIKLERPLWNKAHNKHQQTPPPIDRTPEFWTITEKTAVEYKGDGGKLDETRWDEKFPGFGLRIRRHLDGREGRRSYVYQYRVGRRTRRINLGVVGVVPASEARKLAAKYAVSRYSGDDPAELLKKKRAAA